MRRVKRLQRFMTKRGVTCGFPASGSGFRAIASKSVMRSQASVWFSARSFEPEYAVVNDVAAKCQDLEPFAVPP